MTTQKLEQPATKIGTYGLNNMYMILGDLLNSAALDRDTEAKDCIEVFGEYEWAMTPGCDEALFQHLLEKGINGTITVDELDGFMDMVSREGQTHVYFSIHQGIKSLAGYNDQVRASGSSWPPLKTYELETYQVVALSTGHLTHEDRNALDNAASEGDPMVLKRDTGFFIKFYPADTEDNEGISPSNLRHGHSATLKDIIRWALKCGYSMIEFDCDADALDQFPTYDW
jgi:hypothetical protein